jgi:Cu/Ag efflux protein CusF
MTSSTNRIAAACFTLAMLLAACGATRAPEAQKTGPAKEYQMRGEITGLDAGGHVATIKHEEIKGFMSAMTMGYPVKDPAEFAKLKVGEKINATVYVRDEDMWVANIQNDSGSPGK